MVFSGAFLVFRHIFDIFRAICLVVNSFFVYLQSEKDVDIKNHPEYKEHLETNIL